MNDDETDDRDCDDCVDSKCSVLTNFAGEGAVSPGELVGIGVTVVVAAELAAIMVVSVDILPVALFKLTNGPLTGLSFALLLLLFTVETMFDDWYLLLLGEVFSEPLEELLPLELRVTGHSRLG